MHRAYPSPANSQGSYSPYHGPVDSFNGGYPQAPQLRTVDLPETGASVPNNMGYPTPGPSGHVRHLSLPPDAGALGIYGMNGVATTESGTNAHPILRASSSGLYSPIQYNVLNTPAQATVFATTSSAARGLTSAESRQSAFLPPVPSKSVSVRLYPRNAQPINYNWSVTLTGPRRSSAPPSPAITINDAIVSLHRSLRQPVSDEELRAFSRSQVETADHYRRHRVSSGETYGKFVRADFLSGCVHFAGIVKNSDGSFSVQLKA